MLRVLATAFLLIQALGDFNIPKCGNGLGVKKLVSHDKNVEGTAKIPYFVYAQNGTEATPSTVVTLCHDGKFLHVNVSMVDVDIVATLKGCNSPLFQEDVFQIFLATPTSYPYKYFEIELSPRSELFFADIQNPNLTCSNLGTSYKACELLQYGAKTTVGGWEGWLRLNLTTIGRGSVPSSLLGNMFRIDKNAGQTTKYECWKSTMTNPPCFHKPAVFQKLVLL